MQADDDAYVKQATDAQNAKQSQEALQGGEKPEPSFVSKFMTSVGRASTNTLDWAVSAADSINVMRDRAAHDIGAGIITGATNIADTAGSAITSSGKGLAAAEDPAHAEDAEEGSLPTSPIWDHAKGAILDFRDAVAVKDPTLSDNLLQGAAQLAVPFAGYSRAMAGVHGFANLVFAGGLTDATALGPHDPRMADLIALGRHTEGKFGEVLRTLAPDGGAVNAYINYLTDRGDETEAVGRFKNVLDGFGANMVVTPLLHAVAAGLKYGTAGLRYAVENGVGSAGDLMPANQVGRIGYHGTPTAGFDEFDNAKIGTGEGAQVYGYGHYIAESPATGEHYQQALSARNIDLNTPLGIAQHYVEAAGGDKAKAFVRMTRNADMSTNPGAADTMRKAADMLKSSTFDQGRGALLTVDVPDAHIANMLDHDKTLDEQPDILKKIPKEDQARLEQVLDDHGQNPDLGSLTGGEFRQLVERAHNEDFMVPQDPGETNMPKAASEYFDSKGIPGIKYLDEVSRARRVVDSTGEPVTPKGFAQEEAHYMSIRYGSPEKAMSVAEAKGWGDKDARPDDRAKLEELQKLVKNGAEIGRAGTRNFVVFDGKKIVVLDDKGNPVKKQDMSMSKEERALERERVAAARDREEGVSREHEPEPIPENAARREGAAARRREGRE